MMSIRNSILVVCIAIFTLLNGCLKDRCGSIKCEHKGVCVDGRCACPSGYEGVFCEDRWYEKFEGSWKAEELNAEDTSKQNFILATDGNNKIDTFVIKNFADSLGEVICIRKSYLVFSMIEKQFESGITIVSGEGEIDSLRSIVTGVYSFKKEDKESTVTFTWTR